MRNIPKEKYAPGRHKWGLILGSALAGSFCVQFYGSVLWKEQTLWYALGYLALAAAAGRLLPRRAVRGLAAVHGTGVLAAAAVLLLLSAAGGRYEPVEGSYMQTIYGEPEKVMVIVPHEDDDLNLAAGVIDSYRAAKTQVKVVFLSNGDYHFRSAYRLIEAVRSQKVLGVPEEDVIFLGYGDQYDSDYGSIYNAPASVVVPSHAGYTSTYGLEGHPEYRAAVSGKDAQYSRDDVIADMQELLSQEKPQVIYCVDQDSHADHRAASLIFEEALGNLLRTESGYRPRVYKGFAYSTAWRQPEDYWAWNVESTSMPYADGYMKETNCYRWEERIRLPVLPKDLAYTRQASALYPAFAHYGSQKAMGHFGQIVNGDKVFWQRRTDSLLYSAEFTDASGGSLDMLHDFKLADSSNIAEKTHRPFDGVWAPEKDAILQVRLKQAVSIREIVLYDNPSMEDNVLKARITLDSGQQISVGALKANGSATSIPLPQETKLSGFQVELLKTEGSRAGLCEVEAYARDKEEEQFIKLTDNDGNFLYTYTPEDKGEIRLKIYGSSGKLQELAADPAGNFIWTIDGEEIAREEMEEERAEDQETGEWKNGEQEKGSCAIPVPKQRRTLRVCLKSDPSVYDEIVIRPYSVWRLRFLPVLRSMDKISGSFTQWSRFHLSHLEAAVLKAMGKL